MATIRIGISGWRYTPWRGVFYPPELPQKQELWYASRIFNAIEINGSFYSLQRPAYYRRWHDETPADFIFAVKAPRFITHMKRLRDIATPLANFFASGVFELEAKLGPVLWQLPPSFRYDADVIEPFLDQLPHSTAAALSLARHSDLRMKERMCLAIDADRVMRHCIEIRHESFANSRFIENLQARNIALVVAETAGRWPLLTDITADFMYLRLHGDQELYRSGYEAVAIARWAERIDAWHRGTEPPDESTLAAPADRGRNVERDIYCFFDNTDAKLRAPIDAQTLMRKLGMNSSQVPEPKTYAPRKKRSSKQLQFLE